MLKPNKKGVVIMNKLNINILKFKSILLEECLNYVPYKKLESIVKSSTETLVKKINGDESSVSIAEDRVAYFLEQILLRLSGHESWINTRDKYNLDQKYLYTVIKKYLYLSAPDFLK